MGMLSNEELSKRVRKLEKDQKTLLSIVYDSKFAIERQAADFQRLVNALIKSTER